VSTLALAQLLVQEPQRSIVVREVHAPGVQVALLAPQDMVAVTWRVAWLPPWSENTASKILGEPPGSALIARTALIWFQLRLMV
jgi:hypothetical protein